MTVRPASRRGAITDVPGVRVGHAQRLDARVRVETDDTPGSGWASGVSVVVPPQGSVVAVDVRGGGPGTRETDLLDPVNTVQTAHAIALCGGSAYGLAAADGVMEALGEKGIGLEMNAFGGVVPIVPAAVIYDLPVGDWSARPGASFGRDAWQAAGVDVASGSVGAGTGARAGALKGGVGTASEVVDVPGTGRVTVGALMVVNPVGDVIDPHSGLPWGATDGDLPRWGLRRPVDDEVAEYRRLRAKASVLNTTIGVVATDAGLDGASTRRVAMAAHDGIARAIRPSHSPLDGDTVFAVATGGRDVRPTDAVPPGMNPAVVAVADIGAAAARVVADAIVDAVCAAVAVADVPGYRDVIPSAFGAN